MWKLKTLEYWQIPIHFDAQKHNYIVKHYHTNDLLIIEIITPVKNTFKIFKSIMLKINLNIGKIIGTELWTIDDTNKNDPYMSYGTMRYKDDANYKYENYTRQQRLDIHFEKLNAEVQKRLNLDIEYITENDIIVLQDALINYATKEK